MKIAFDLDAVVGDTRPLWHAWLKDAARRYRPIASLDPVTLPHDRAKAATVLDEWASAGVGDWRAALVRFAEDRAPLFVRPDAEVTGALRRLQAAGARLVAYTDAPDALAEVAVAHLGVRRRLEAIESGHDAERRAVGRLGEGARVVRSRDDLIALAP